MRENIEVIQHLNDRGSKERGGTEILSKKKRPSQWQDKNKIKIEDFKLNQSSIAQYKD